MRIIFYRLCIVLCCFSLQVLQPAAERSVDYRESIHTRIEKTFHKLYQSKPTILDTLLQMEELFHKENALYILTTFMPYEVLHLVQGDSELQEYIKYATIDFSCEATKMAFSKAVWRVLCDRKEYYKG